MRLLLWQEAFKLNIEFKDAWSARLTSPVLQKVDLETFFFDVERKFNKEKRGSAVDVDIFANKASPDDEGELEHLEELVSDTCAIDSSMYPYTNFCKLLYIRFNKSHFFTKAFRIDWK